MARCRSESHLEEEEEPCTSRCRGQKHALHTSPCTVCLYGSTEGTCLPTYWQRSSAKAQNDAAAEGGTSRMGWESIREPSTLVVQKRLSQLQNHGCETLDTSDVLTDERREQLEATDDSSAPVDLVAATGLEGQVSEGTSNSNCSGYINPDQPIVQSDGSHIAD